MLKSINHICIILLLFFPILNSGIVTPRVGILLPGTEVSEDIVIRAVHVRVLNKQRASVQISPSVVFFCVLFHFLLFPFCFLNVLAFIFSFLLLSFT